MPFFAILDACVLYPYSLRDTLPRFAESEFSAPLWSERILDEMERSVVSGGVDSAKAKRMRQMMERAFDDACVPAEAIVAIEGSMNNDAGDHHVLAAAVASSAEVLVTANLKRFSLSSTQPYDIDVQHPDKFLAYLFDLDPRASVALIQQQADDQVSPPITVDALLLMLENAGAPHFAQLIRDERLRARAGAPPTLW